MEKTTFLLLMIVYLVAYGSKKSVLKMLHRKEKLLWLSQEVLTYIFIAIFLILMVIGVLYTKNNDYSNVSEGFEKVRSKTNSNRPEKYFDVNTYKDLYED